jgi:hypothetical protein
MAQSQQDAAVTAALAVLDFAGRFRSLWADAKAYKARADHAGYDGIWKKLPTAAWAADGSIGAEDAAPVATNPIILGGVNRSENDLLGVLYLMADFVTFMENGVAPQSDRATVIDKVVG